MGSNCEQGIALCSDWTEPLWLEYNSQKNRPNLVAGETKVARMLLHRLGTPPGDGGAAAVEPHAGVSGGWAAGYVDGAGAPPEGVVIASSASNALSGDGES